MKLIEQENALRDTLQKMEHLDLFLAFTLKKASDGLVGNAKFRITVLGEDSNNNPMITYSPVSVGRYSKMHAMERRAQGLQTDYVDLTMSGDMMASFKVLSTDSSESEIGFDSDTQALKAIWNERTFMTDIFNPTDEEAKEALDFLEKEIEQLL
jgi:hypothetical protein